MYTICIVTVKQNRVQHYTILYCTALHCIAPRRIMTYICRSLIRDIISRATDSSTSPTAICTKRAMNLSMNPLSNSV